MTGRVLRKNALTHFCRFFGLPDDTFASEVGRNMVALLASAIVSGLFLFAANILAVRMLGPVEYGRYSLVVSLGNLFLIPILFGLHSAIVRYVAPQKDAAATLGVGLTTGGLCIVCVSGMAFLASSSLAEWFDIDSTLLKWGIAYGTGYALFSLAKASLQGLHRLRQFALIEAGMGLVVFLSLTILLIIFGRRDFRVPAISYFLGWTVVILAVSWIIRSTVRLGLQRSLVRTLLHYGFLSVLGGVSGFFLSYVDRIFVFRLFGAEETGIYSAYNSAAFMLTTPVNQVFITVLFPAISRLADKREGIRRVTNIESRLYPLLFFCSLVGITVLLKIFGPSYPFHFAFVFLFALYGTLFIASSIRYWMIAAIGRKGATYTAIHGLIASGLIVIGNFGLLPRIGIAGAALAGIAAFIYMCITAGLFFRRYDAQPERFDE